MLRSLQPRRSAITSTERHRPQAEDDFDLAEEVQHFRGDARPRRHTRDSGLFVAARLDRVRGQDEPRREKRVDDREDEDGRRDHIQRLGSHPIEQHGVQTRTRVCWICRER